MAVLNSNTALCHNNPFKQSFVSQKVVSQATGLSEAWLEGARFRGNGPPFYKVGRRCLYDLAETLDWVKAQRRTSTSEG